MIGCNTGGKLIEPSNSNDVLTANEEMFLKSLKFKSGLFEFDRDRLYCENKQYLPIFRSISFSHIRHFSLY